MKTKCRQCGLEVLIGLDGLCADCVSLRDKPDGVSKMTSLGGVPFKDMKQLDEPERFKLIADFLLNNPGQIIQVYVENTGANKGKGDRYIAGVLALVPLASVRRAAGVVPRTETLIFRL